MPTSLEINLPHPWQSYLIMYKGTEAKAIISTFPAVCNQYMMMICVLWPQPSDIPMPRFEHGW